MVEVVPTEGSLGEAGGDHVQGGSDVVMKKQGRGWEDDVVAHTCQGQQQPARASWAGIRVQEVVGAAVGLRGGEGSVKVRAARSVGMASWLRAVQTGSPMWFNGEGGEETGATTGDQNEGVWRTEEFVYPPPGPPPPSEP